MKSLEELKAIRDRMKGTVGVRVPGDDHVRVVVGMATCGIASGARPVLNTLAEEVRRLGLDKVTVTQTGCIGLCQYEPIVEAAKENHTLLEVNNNSLNPMGARKNTRENII